MNTNPDLYHIIKQTGNTESDQRQHLKIPDGIIAVARDTFSDIVRKINMSMKRGRCQ
ncbi:MAG: hypothetical protein MK132_09070 [Lentisphaerales bacterium]|nr:hypothetical protein [Lentisphaerales bacterium]